MNLSKKMKIGFATFLIIIVCASTFLVNALNDKSDLSTADFSGNKIPISKDYFGFNTQMINGPNWNNEKFLNAVIGLYPHNLRYPGGTIGNYWDWKKGWFINSPQVPKQYSNLTPNPIMLVDFKKAISATGAMPVFMLNMLTSDLNYQLEMLRYAKSIELPIKYIELGNEFFGKEEAATLKYQTGREYAIESNKWIEAIKKEFPEAKIAVVGCGNTDVPHDGNKSGKVANSKERIESWDDLLFENVRGADAVTYHIYVGAGIQTGSMKSKGKNNPEVQALKTKAFDNQVEQVLGMPYVKIQQLEKYNNNHIPKGMKIWYTEYNLFEKDLVVSGTWAHGLYVSLLTLLFLDDPHTEIACNHNITKNARFAAIFNDENGFENSLNAIKTTPFGYTAGGVTLSLLGNALADKTVAQKLIFSNAPLLKSIKQISYPSLTGYKFTSGNTESLVIYNLSSACRTVDLKKVIDGKFNYKIVSAQPLKQIGDVKDLLISTGSGNDKIQLPPYSIVLINK